MTININNNQGQNSGGGGSISDQPSPYLLMVRNSVKTCKALDSFKDASVLLLNMVDVVKDDAEAMAELTKGIEEVRAFFEKRNTPQPSIKGCNVFIANPDSEIVIGNLGVIAKKTTINGNMPFCLTLLADSYSDEQVKRVLEANVGKDKVIDTKWKWCAAYWLLRCVCNYPADLQKFCTKIHELNLSVPPNKACTYNDIRKYCMLSFIQSDVRKMDEIKVNPKDQIVFNKVREIVIKLGEDLVNVGL